MSDTQTDHASDAYLAGLSEMDRARAIVAVRWCGAKWASRHPDNGPSYRFLSIYGGGNTMLNVKHPPHERAIDGKGWPDWGTSWTGTASLMVLAESKGWQLSMVRGIMSPDVRLFHLDHGDAESNYAATLHEAVLLACAKAAQMEAP